MSTKRATMNMTEGRTFYKILLFSLFCGSFRAQYKPAQPLPTIKMSVFIFLIV